MIYAVTSKKSGCGRSTVALLLSILTQSKVKGQIALVDLSYGNDFMSMLKIEDQYPTIDNLISSISLEMNLSFERNLVETHGFFLLPGTKVKQTRYLEKRYTEIVEIVKEIESKFNSVILDIDYPLYEELVDNGLNITPFYVLDQNMLNVEKYHDEIHKKIYDGFYIINRYNKDVFPPLDLFEKNFKKGSIVCVLDDDYLKSVLNKKKIALSVLKNSPTFPGINKLSTIVAENLSITSSAFSVKDKKKGFFSYFKVKPSNVSEINSLKGLTREKVATKTKEPLEVKKNPSKKRRLKSRKGENDGKRN